MPDLSAPDAIVVGSGPNGLAAAITLARAGHSVIVFGAKETAGGGCRSGELTFPGFVHDVCSAVHPLGVASPFFRTLPLAEHGLQWVHPDIPLAHPLDDGTAVLLHRSLEATAEALGRGASASRRLIAPLVHQWDRLTSQVLRPLLPLPRHPLVLAHFGLLALRSASGLARGEFKEERARALFAGLAAPPILPLDRPFTAPAGPLLGA